MGSKSTAVIIPCLNEESAIGKVVRDFSNSLPDSRIFVFDNNSTDETRSKALEAGAEVIHVAKKGKGNVVRAMFRDVDADLYVMTDGDDTYPAGYAKEMVTTAINQKADMVVGNRMTNYLDSDSRKGHFTGNQLLTSFVNFLFNSELKDLLSGYRVMSRRFVKSIPLFSEGFEVETMLSIHALEVDAKIVEIPIEYKVREHGTESKLNTLQDGFKIGLTILILFKDNFPKLTYGVVSAIFFILSLITGVPVIIEFINTGLVPKFPSAILASGLMVLSVTTFFAGIILSAVSKARREIKKMTFMKDQ